MRAPAIQLNGFIQKLAIWLKNNQPDFVEGYGVTVSHVPKEDDHSQIRFILNFDISNSKVRDLDGAGLISERLDT